MQIADNVFVGATKGTGNALLVSDIQHAGQHLLDTAGNTIIRAAGHRIASMVAQLGHEILVISEAGEHRCYRPREAKSPTPGMTAVVWCGSMYSQRQRCHTDGHGSATITEQLPLRQSTRGFSAPAPAARRLRPPRDKA